VAFVAGGALLTVGAGMVVFGDSRSDASVAVRARPIVSNRDLGLGLEGTF
jgi:hypothetical protein